MEVRMISFLISAQVRIAESQLVHISRRKGFDDKISRFDQVAKNPLPVLCFQVERDSPFAAVVCKPVQAFFRIRLIVPEGTDLSTRRSPPGFSTLMTSTPSSARILPHKNPFSSVKSRARYPSSILVRGISPKLSLWLSNRPKDPRWLSSHRTQAGIHDQIPVS